MNDQVLTLADVAVSLGGRPVLRHIELSVTQGEVVALLGANGSGKSTLVRTMLGLVPTCRGARRGRCRAGPAGRRARRRRR